MNAILHHFDGPAWHATVTALLHTLWQAPLVAVALYLILRRVPAERCQTRYLLTLAGLGCVLLAGLVTHGVLIAGGNLDQARTGTDEAVPISTRTGNIDATAGAASGAAVNASVPSTASASPSPRALASRDRAVSLAFWRPVAAVAWIVGVGVMLIRASVSCVVLRRWTTAAPSQSTPDLVCRSVENLVAAMRITRPIRVVMTDRLGSPAVMGVLWPTILLPPATLLGLTPEQLRVVLAHELAHIRRHDYLVNLVQKLIEALLFFNPAVWWISRQVRVEREACCDDLATRVIGDPAAVARVLYEFAAMTAATNPLAAAFGGNDSESSVAERVRRIVRPGNSPTMRLPWYTFLILGTAVLAGVLFASRGVDSAVVLAAKALSGPEHIEHIEQIESLYGEANRQGHRELLPEERVRISGTVRTHDGRPLPENLRGVIHSVYRNSLEDSGPELEANGSWRSEHVQPGRIVVVFNGQGYAPAVAGPLMLDPAEARDDIEVVLTDGFSTRLQILDENDRPVPDAPLSVRVTAHDAWVGRRNLRTDDSGLVVLDRLCECTLEVETVLPGYQRFHRTFNALPDTTQVLRLQPSKPVTGEVISASTGEPVPHTQIRIVLQSTPNGRNHLSDPRFDYERRKSPCAIADALGRFRIDSLESGSTYTFWFEAPQYQPALIYAIAPGMADLTVSLHKSIVIQVEVVGSLDGLRRNEEGKPELHYVQGLKCGPDSTTSFEGNAVIELSNGKQIAMLDDLILPGSLTILTPSADTAVHVENAATADHVVVDLRPQAAPDARTVIVKVIPPEGWPTPKGRLCVHYVPPGSRSYDKLFQLDLAGGEVSIDVPLNEDGVGRFRYGPLSSPGYWIEDKSQVLIHPGEGPHVIEVPAEPAGSIYGVVTDAAGRPHEFASISLRLLEHPEEAKIDVNLLQASTDMNGRFAIDQVPLSGRYRAVAHDYHACHEGRVWGEVIEVNRQQPTREVRLVIPAGTDVPVQVLGPDEAPVAGAKVALNFNSPEGGVGGAMQTCDPEGRWTFKGVNFDLPGRYSVVAAPLTTLSGTEVDVAPKHPTTTIRLRAGVGLDGVLINDKTGEPMPGKIVSAYPYEANNGLRPPPVETRTDKSGRFVFQNLAPIAYYLHVQGTDRSDAEIIERPDSNHIGPYSGQRFDAMTITLPRTTDEPYELRVVPRTP